MRKKVYDLCMQIINRRTYIAIAINFYLTHPKKSYSIWKILKQEAMQKLIVTESNGALVFQLDEKTLKAFDIDDFTDQSYMLLPYADNFININVIRNKQTVDVLRTTAQRGKYQGDTGEMMFCGLMANSTIIREWRKKNPHFLGITAFTTGICASMFEKGDVLEIEHSFKPRLEEVFTNGKCFIN